MIQQKAGELMFNIDASRREMTDLQQAIWMTECAQSYVPAD
jgi:hypothetical protein